MSGMTGPAASATRTASLSSRATCALPSSTASNASRWSSGSFSRSSTVMLPSVSYWSSCILGHMTSLIATMAAALCGALSAIAI